MNASRFSAEILSTAQCEFERLLADFDANPSRDAFWDIGAALEILALARDVPASRTMVRALTDAGRQWLRSGLLEDIFFSNSDVLYHGALLLYLLRQEDNTPSTEMSIIERMLAGRVIGQNEFPVLVQETIGTLLAECGFSVDPHNLGSRDTALLLDKRILRTRSDESDVVALIICGQLLQLSRSFQPTKPRFFPAVLAIQAMRSGDLNWIAVLAFLCVVVFQSQKFDMDTHIAMCMPEHVQLCDLVPPPKWADCKGMFIQRTARGFRLRSTIALALYFGRRMETSQYG